MKRMYMGFILLLFVQAAFPRGVLTGLYLINMGSFDIDDGTIDVDFYISFSSVDSSVKLPDINFEIINGTEKSRYIANDLTHEKIYRVKATILVPVNLRDFPFEKHSLKIILEDKVLSISKLEFTADKLLSGLDESVFIPGYDIDSWNVETGTHYYPAFKEDYSQFIYYLNIEKPILNAFLKTLMPVICMVIVVLLSFFIQNSEIENRIAAITSGLLGVIMFHASVAGQLPPIGYLTFADKVFLISYAIIIASLLITLFTMRMMKANNELAGKIYSKTKCNILVIYVIIIFFYCFFTIK
jgi:hypothetical protein